MLSYDINMDEFKIKKLEKKTEEQKKEINRITKAFVSLQEFYEEEKKLNEKYKNKLLNMGVVLL
tara:strand:+ start:758 stop:949 length:192 start_codon:yes stop_codon:yes gene_type:complete